MIAYKGSPRAWQHRGHETNRTDRIISDRIPFCKLHGCRIVYRFPDGCPYNAANPLDRLYAIRSRGWRQLSNATTEDHRGGLTLLAIDDICNACIDRLCGHPHVVRLRAGGGRDG